MARLRRVNTSINLPSWNGTDILVESLSLLESPWGGGYEYTNDDGAGTIEHGIDFPVPHSGESARLTITNTDPTTMEFTIPNGFDHNHALNNLKVSVTCMVDGSSSVRQFSIGYVDSQPNPTAYTVTNDTLPTVSGHVLLVWIEITSDTTDVDIINIRDTLLGLTEDFILYVGTYTGLYTEISEPINDVGGYFDALLTTLVARKSIGSVYPPAVLVSTTNNYPCLLDAWETHLSSYTDYFKSVWFFTETENFTEPSITGDPLYGIGSRIIAEGKTQVHFFSTRLSNLLSNDYYDEVWHPGYTHAALAVADCESGSNVFFNHATRGVINGAADYRHITLGYAVHLQHGLQYYDPTDFTLLTTEPVDSGVYHYYYTSGTLLYRAFRPDADITIDAETFTVEAIDGDGNITTFDFAFGVKAPVWTIP